MGVVFVELGRTRGVGCLQQGPREGERAALWGDATPNLCHPKINLG